MTEPLGSMRRFGGKVVLVTGAASGIGRATALRFASEGARLALCDLNDEPLQALCVETGRPAGDLYARAVDVADPEALERFILEAAQRLAGSTC